MILKIASVAGHVLDSVRQQQSSTAGQAAFDGALRAAAQPHPASPQRVANGRDEPPPGLNAEQRARWEAMARLLGDIAALERVLDTQGEDATLEGTSLADVRDAKVEQLHDLIGEEIFEATKDTELTDIETAVAAAQEDLKSWGLDAEGEDTFADAVDEVGGERLQRLRDIETLRDEIAGLDELAPGLANANPEIQQQRNEKADELHGLLVGEIHYATQDLAIPGDRLEAVLTDLKALRPHDQSFAAAVDEAGASAQELWQMQGRSHETLGVVLDLAEDGQWQAVQDEIMTQFEVLATTTPTVEAIEGYKTTLLNYGPDSARYRQAVEDTAREFLVERPRQAADEVAQAFEEGGTLAELYEDGRTAPLEPDEEFGALAAAAKLREVTDPEHVDPLTAALILEQSEPTINEIIEHFGSSDVLEMPDGYVITLDYAQLRRMFSDLSAAADSASRSDRADPVIERMAGNLLDAQFVDDDFIPHQYQDYSNYISLSVFEGNGVILPLEMARQLQLSGDIEQADLTAEAVIGGVEAQQAGIRDSVHDLGETMLPLTNPSSNWDIFLPNADTPGGHEFNTPEETVEAWLNDDDNAEFVEDVGNHLDGLNADGHALMRSMAGLAEYAPQLDGLENQEALRDLGEFPDPENEPELSLALAISPAAFFEGYRLDGMEGAQSDQVVALSKIVPDPSWPARMGRNHVQAVIEYYTGSKPVSAGLSLYGVATYVLGVRNHGAELRAKIEAEGVWGALLQADGWRNLGFLLMYTGGIGIEGVQVVSPAARQPSSSWSKKVFKGHLKWFGWWNVAGSLNYFAQGDWQRGTALGIAAGGTLLSTYGTAAWTGPVGTLAVLVGSATLMGLDQRARVHLANKTEPFNKAYLIAAGVPEEIADELANNDDKGRSPAPVFLAMAEELGVSPHTMLAFLTGLEHGELKTLVETAHGVDPDEEGNFPDPEDDPWGGSEPPRMRYVEPSPRSIEGLIHWAEYHGYDLPRYNPAPPATPIPAEPNYTG